MDIGQLGKRNSPLPTLFNFLERQHGAFASLAQYISPLELTRFPLKGEGVCVFLGGGGALQLLGK